MSIQVGLISYESIKEAGLVSMPVTGEECEEGLLQGKTYFY